MKFNKNEVIFFDKKGQLITSENFFGVIQMVKNNPHIKKSKKIALLLNVPYEFAASFFALVSMGKEIVLLPNQLQKTKEQFQDEYEYCLEDVYQENFLDSSMELNLVKETKITLFTSGSLGLPKKSSKTFAHLLKEVEVLEELFGKEMKDSLILSTVSHQHIYGLLFRILWPLLKKRPVANFNIEYPEELLNLEEKDFSLISSPAFLKRQELKIPCQFKKIFSSGGKLETAAAKLTYQNFGIFPEEIYGSTETGGIAYKKGENSVWRFFPGVKGCLALEEGLKITSPFISEAFFQTSDRVKFTSEDSFFLLERIDRICKIEEKRISLDELEKRLNEHHEIKESYCLVISFIPRTVLGCLIVFKENSKMKNKEKRECVEEIKTYLSQYFEKVVLPKKYRFVSSLPYNEQSKLNKEKVLEYFYE